MSFGDLKVQDLIYEDSSNNEITVVIADLATKANPVFSGTVTVPTATANDNTTKAASTAYVQTELGDYLTTATATSTYAPKNAPAFTGSATGVNLTLSGDLTVNGTTTTINTTTLQVEDKNIEIGKVASPSDTTADGGGWSLLGSTTKTFNWVNATDAWTSSEHIHILDDKKLLVGTGSDLEIFHNGTNSIISNQTGDLSIRSPNNIVFMDYDAEETFAKFVDNGAVELYHNNVKKIETSATGCTVTGTLAATAVTGDGSGLTNLPPAGNTVDLVADGAIAAGKPVIITTAGKAKQVGGILVGRTNAPTNKLLTDLTTQDEYYSMVWDTNREVVVMGYRDMNGGVGVNIFTYSTALDTSTVTNNGQTTAYSSGVTKNTSMAWDPDTNQFLLAYRYSTAGFLSVGSVAANKSVTYGTASEWDGSSPDELYVEYNTDQNKVIVVFRKSNQLWARAGTVSGTGISGWGTAVQLSGVEITADGKLDTCWDSTNNKVLVVFCPTNDSNKVKVVALSCSGTTLTWGTPGTINTISGEFPRITFDSDLGKACATYKDNDNSGYGRIQVVYISSGTTIASGTSEYMTSTIAGISGNNYVKIKGHQSVYDPVGNYFYIVSCWTNSPTVTDRVFSYQWKINNSNNGITRNSTYIRLLDSAQCQDHKWNTSMVVMGSTGKMVSVVRNIPNSYKPRLYLSELITSSSNANPYNVIGFAPSAISDTATGTIHLPGNVVGNQSSLSAGTQYYVQGNGTLATTQDTTLGGSTGMNKAGIALSSTSLLISDYKLS